MAGRQHGQLTEPAVQLATPGPNSAEFSRHVLRTAILDPLAWYGHGRHLPRYSLHRAPHILRLSLFALRCWIRPPNP